VKVTTQAIFCVYLFKEGISKFVVK